MWNNDQTYIDYKFKQHHSMFSDAIIMVKTLHKNILLDTPPNLNCANITIHQCIILLYHNGMYISYLQQVKITTM